ncbi:MAG: hypothetical protein US50_C0023G0003 [Candidatus Nomurabacteria bacterium GW2011_GWB1_37_5]|uniref:VWFA domain-containing protein n=1 Tax=Candidatus Nomurabacteria bacterium GW2011_GWB1_37_5 TaxID=1618742 RepID=A0A0G0K3G5_9BACT|nr:MAG: hypothetical protein US50_C0023G0003 [Candidatus Nomurabacteria bacterium GW2011_GWB1_37_5]
MKSKNTNLLTNAAQNGNLTQDALKAIQKIPDLGAQLQEAMGVSIDDVDASEVVLVGMLLDDSGSIRMAGNSKTVCDGHNLVIDSVKKSKQGNGVLALAKYLNGKLLYPWVPIDQAVKMDSSNYDACGGTPLYDETVAFLATVAAKAEEFEQMAGVPVRSIILIVTDGADVHSQKQTAKSVAAVANGMLRSEKHIIAGMGISDGSTDFKQVFSEMGIPDNWILTPGNSEKEIRASFQLFSQSAVRASQSAGSFSKTAMGGFGTP